MLDSPTPMRDRWHDSPFFAVLALLAFFSYFWWEREHEAAQMGHVLLVTMMFVMVLVNRDRLLSKRIAMLTESVEVLTAIVNNRAAAEDPPSKA